MKKILLCALVAACGGSKAADSVPPVAAAVEAKAPAAGGALVAGGGGSVTGMVSVSAMGDGTHVDVKVTGATPGKHGIHFHENGECTPPDFKSAGAHWNPSGVAHGGPDKEPHHAGDLGNFEVGADGTGTASIHLPGVKLDQVVGKSLVVHAKEDDLTTQPSGASGDRIACAVIVAAP
jgi:Cu-Zn family superoxide dismutase